MDHTDDPLLTRPYAELTLLDVRRLQTIALSLAAECETLAAEVFRLKQDFGSGTVPATSVVSDAPLIATVGQVVRLSGLQAHVDIDDQ